MPNVFFNLTHALLKVGDMLPFYVMYRVMATDSLFGHDSGQSSPVMAHMHSQSRCLHQLLFYDVL